jgi:hypothetical protein
VSQDGTYRTPENQSIHKGSYETGHAGSCSDLQNDAGTRAENPHKTRTVCSGNVPDPAKENPGALAGATGAESLEKSGVVSSYPGSTSRAIVQMIEAAESGDADACTMALRGLERLPATYRATIAALSLGSLDDDDAAHVVDATLRTAGFPLSDRVAPMQAARFWSERASRAERKAYAAACFEALHPDDQAAFLRRYAREVAA